MAQHHHRQIGGAEALAQHIGALLREAGLDAVPGLADLRHRLGLDLLDMPGVGRVPLRVIEEQIERLDRIGEVEHPLGVEGAIRIGDRRCQARLRMPVGQIHGDGVGLEHHPAAVQRQDRHFAVGIERQIFRRLVLPLVHVDELQLVGRTRFLQRHMRHQRGAGRIPMKRIHDVSPFLQMSNFDRVGSQPSTSASPLLRRQPSDVSSPGAKPPATGAELLAARTNMSPSSAVAMLNSV